MKTIINRKSPVANPVGYKNSPAMLTVFGKIDGRLETAEYILADHDFNLGQLIAIANAIWAGRNAQNCLGDLAAFTIQWLKKINLDEADIFERIANERLRQRELFAERHISFSVSSRVVSAARKFRVLIEEIGEVAEAIDFVEQHPRSELHRDRLITELVQVAAVAVAWLESFEA